MLREILYGFIIRCIIYTSPIRFYFDNLNICVSQIQLLKVFV